MAGPIGTDAAPSIERIDCTNYAEFRALTFARANGREPSGAELAAVASDAGHLKTLGDPNLYLFAARLRGRLAGYVSAVYVPKVGSGRWPGHFFVDELWTRPECRRLGIAAALMARAEAEARAFGAVGLRLYAGGDNAAALALYDKCGYVSRGGDAVFLEKPLI